MLDFNGNIPSIIIDHCIIDYCIIIDNCIIEHCIIDLCIIIVNCIIDHWEPHGRSRLCNALLAASIPRQTAQDHVMQNSTVSKDVDVIKIP